MVRRHRRAGSWSPPLVAAMARSLTREEHREADRAHRINENGYAAEFTEASAATATVAAPMARLAMDASQDIPAINGADAPAQVGVMAWFQAA